MTTVSVKEFRIDNEGVASNKRSFSGTVTFQIASGDQGPVENMLVDVDFWDAQSMNGAVHAALANLAKFLAEAVDGAKVAAQQYGFSH